VQHLIYFYNIKIKYLQHTSETAETLSNTSETLAKHQKKLENTWVAITNIQIKHLQHTYEKHLKHLHICDIQIYFCNIK
jgi:hypothetical protein